MRPASAAYLRSIRGSQWMAARARVVETWQTGINPVGTEVEILGGDVKFDGTADVWSTADLSTSGAGWDPRPGRSPLTPLGNELFLERGVHLSASNVEWVPLGYYRINDVDQDPAPDGPLQIVGRDRMAGIIESDLPRPKQFKKTASVSGVFATLVREIYPTAVIEFDDATGAELLGRAQIVDQSRYTFLRDLANSHGKVMHFDHRGVLVVRSPPAVTNPVWEVDAGEGGVLVKASRSVSREGVFNAVVAEGEAPDGDNPPVRVIALDADPDSPTYYYGRFGKVHHFLSSSNISRTGQAASAARGMLERNLGVPYLADFSAVPNAALEPWDPIRVKYNDRTGREVHVLRTLTVPLVADVAMTGTTRERTGVQISVQES